MVNGVHSNYQNFMLISNLHSVFFGGLVLRVGIQHTKKELTTNRIFFKFLEKFLELNLKYLRSDILLYF
jgi:hypothetical protein